MQALRPVGSHNYQQDMDPVCTSVPHPGKGTSTEPTSGLVARIRLEDARGGAGESSWCEGLASDPH